MLAAATALDAEFPRITVDADVSRMPKRIFDRIRERKRVGRLGDVVVIGAGTNGRIRSADLTAILTLLKDRKRVVLVTCHGDRSWIAQSNSVDPPGGTAVRVRATCASPTGTPTPPATAGRSTATASTRGPAPEPRPTPAWSSAAVRQ